MDVGGWPRLGASTDSDLRADGCSHSRPTTSFILGCSTTTPHRLRQPSAAPCHQNRVQPPPPLSPASILRIAWVTRPLQLLWRVLTFWARVPAPAAGARRGARRRGCGEPLRSRARHARRRSIWDGPLANGRNRRFVGSSRAASCRRSCTASASHAQTPPPGRRLRGLPPTSARRRVPMLVRRHRRRRQPALVVMLREPVAQNLSWWRLELNAGMAWGGKMGPSTTTCAAADASRSPTLRDATRSRGRRRWPRSVAGVELLGAGVRCVGVGNAVPAAALRLRCDGPRRRRDPALAGARGDATFDFVTLDELGVGAALGAGSASPMPSRARAPSAATSSSRRSCARRPTRRPRRRRRASTTRRRSPGRRSSPTRRRCASSPHGTDRATSASSSCSGGTWAGTTTRGTTTTGSGSSSIISLR